MTETVDPVVSSLPPAPDVPPGLAPVSAKVVVTITGPQSPRALADVMYVLGTSSKARLTDFGQLVVRGKFTATAVVAPAVESEDGPSADEFRDIIVRAHSVGFQVDFDASSRSWLRARVSGASGGLESNASAAAPAVGGVAEADAAVSDDYIVTLFAPGRLPAQLVADTTRVIAESGANISSINRLSDVNDDYMCLEMAVRVPVDKADEVRREMFVLGRAQASVDIAMQPARVTRMSKRIVVFDLSWTLVRCDAVDILLDAAGVSASESDREAYVSGQISGSDWLRKRVALLKGADADAVNASATASMSYTDGARQLCKGLKRLGCRLAVVSSGSRKIAEQAKEELGLDFAYGNNFETDPGNRFTGIVSDPIIDAERKADLLQMLAMQEGVDSDQVVAVGDGPVSSKMLSAAGMSVAFDQPDSVEGVQTGRISSKSLASVFYLLGVTGRDFRELLDAS